LVQIFIIIFILFYRAVDFVNMMGYDYNGWGFLDPLTGYNSPLFPESYDKHFFNTNNLVSFNFFIFKSVKKKKNQTPQNAVYD
jgi:GH18 family chitinase